MNASNSNYPDYYDYSIAEPESDDSRPLAEYIPPAEDLRSLFWDKDESGGFLPNN